MVKKVFSIYDEKAEAFAPPFLFNTIGEATRAISGLIADESHQFCKHTSDFTLFILGEFDDCKGEFVLDKHSVGSLVEFKTSSNVTNIREA